MSQGTRISRSSVAETIAILLQSLHENSFAQPMQLDADAASARCADGI